MEAVSPANKLTHQMQLCFFSIINETDIFSSIRIQLCQFLFSFNNATVNLITSFIHCVTLKTMLMKASVRRTAKEVMKYV